MQSTIQYIEKELNGYYPQTEIQGFIRMLFQHVCGMDFTTLAIRKNDKLDVHSRKEIEKIVLRLKKFEPVQYILGETDFYGLKLQVNPSVLIPRPETEELVDWVIAENQNESIRILDIGTGSGCIALALKKGLKNAKVDALDISNEAIKTARQNAGINNLEVELFYGDILNFSEKKFDKYDVIVSNPPYVRQSEKAQMQANVLNYEPGRSLFVSDEDPLIFYKAICSFAMQYLNVSGKLYLEINEMFGKKIMKLFTNAGFIHTKLKKDIHGKNRMFRCELHR